MHSLFTETYPAVKVSYKSYRGIFNKHFNISFSLPWIDTCSTCDEYAAKVKCFELEKSTCSNVNDLKRIDNELSRLKTMNYVHKLKADNFYKRKNAKFKVESTPTWKQSVWISKKIYLYQMYKWLKFIYYRWHLCIHFIYMFYQIQATYFLSIQNIMAKMVVMISDQC